MLAKRAENSKLLLSVVKRLFHDFRGCAVTLDGRDWKLYTSAWCQICKCFVPNM